MRPSWILSDEERVRRFHGRGGNIKSVDKNKKQRQGVSVVQEMERGTGDVEDMVCDEDTNSIGANSSNSDEGIETGDDGKDTVLQLITMIRRLCTARHDDIDTSVLREILQITLNGAPMTQSTAAHLHDIINSRTKTCLQMLPEFQSLGHHDRDAILEHNLPLIHRFRQAICLHTKDMSWTKMMEILIGKEVIKEETENLPTDLSGSPKKCFQYSDMFTGSWVQSKEVETVHKSLMEDITSWVDTNDDIQIILIILILAFNHDFLDLEGRSQVEKIQLKYVILLQSHLRSRYPNSVAASKLTKAVMLPAVTREIVQITKDRFVI